MCHAILNLLMELHVPALQEERFLEHGGKMLKDQENGSMKKLWKEQGDHVKNIAFKDPVRHHLPRVFV